MHNFKKRIMEKDKYEVDQLILKKIEDILNRLEKELEEEEYKKHIENRKKVLQDIYKKFDYNIQVMDEEKQRDLLNNKSINKGSNPGIEKILDKVIRRKIETGLNNFYKEKKSLLNTEINNNQTEVQKERILTLVIERTVKTSEFLEDCDDNLKRIQRHKENKDNITKQNEINNPSL